MMDKRLTLFIPAACGMGFFLGIELGGYQLILLQVAQSFKLSNVMMGVLVSSQFITATAGPLLFGWVADRYGKKIILLIFMPVFMLGCFSAAFSGAVTGFVFSIFIVGMGYSICECISSSALSDSFPGKESRYLNIMQSTFCLGAVISPQIFNRLIAAGLVTWRAVFILAGGGFVLIYPLLCLSRCKPHTQKSINEMPGTKGKQGIISPLLFALLTAMLAYVAIETGTAFFANVIFVTEYSNNELGAYAISGFWLSMTVSRFIFALTKIKMRNMVLTGLAASFLLLLLLLLIRNPWILMGIFISLGAVIGPVWPMLMGIGASSFRERSGTITSILYSSGGFSGAMIPVLFGWISGRAGFYGGFWILAAFSAIGFFAIWTVKEKRSEDCKGIAD